ncbi:MAG: hypothetical protein E7480_06965 [Ruminococcaceae bacterium]|nr:hypothetical protein [Oscillospiraceae bacterium]
MLNNLRAELVRKGFNTPAEAVADALSCTAKTARNKLDGISPVTVPEAVKIIEMYFSKDNFTIEYLFAQTQTTICCVEQQSDERGES